MRQQDRDVLKALHGAPQGERTPAAAARLLGWSARPIRRLRRRPAATGDQALVHGPRGQPSDHRADPASRAKVLQAYRRRSADFGPASAGEALAEGGRTARPQPRRRRPPAEGRWPRRRRRDPHRRRRPRRAGCGALVPSGASIHDRPEGRGEERGLSTAIADASSRLLARCYPAGTVATPRDLVGRWRRRSGRPRASSTGRHSIFEPRDQGQALPDAETPFGRAPRELGSELIRAHSPPAQGRAERSFGAAQGRWVKGLRLAKATSCAEADAALGRLFPAPERRFRKAPRQAAAAHRPPGAGRDPAALLSIQGGRGVADDDTLRCRNRSYRRRKPVHPGERGGKVVVASRRDGGLARRFRDKCRKYQGVTGAAGPGGSAPGPPGLSAGAADASGGSASAPGRGGGARVVGRTADRRALGPHSCGARSS